MGGGEIIYITIVLKYKSTYLKVFLCGDEVNTVVVMVKIMKLTFIIKG